MFFAQRKNLILTFCLGLGALVITATLGQRAVAHPSPDPGPLKIGVIDLEGSIMATEDGKKEAAALNQQFAPQQTDLEKLQAEIVKMQKDLKTQADKLSETERTNRVHEIENKEREYNRHKQEAQGEVRDAEQRMFARLSGKMLRVVQTYSQAKGYTVIFDASSPQTPVLYASADANISREIVDAYNKTPDTPAAAATPAPAAKK